MDIEQLKQILDLVRDHELSEFEIEHDGLRLKVRKDGVGHVVASAAMPAAARVEATPVSAAASAAAVPLSAGATAAAEGAVAGEASIELAVMKSPIVGTFYRSAEPGSPPFVDIGSVVKKGQVLCIVEAMKLMNEIDSEYDGEIVAIYVENGQPVQYGERLFAIKTR